MPSTPRRSQLLAAAGLVGTGLASTLLADRLDRRKIAADPVWTRLSDIPIGETRTVEGGGRTPLHVELHGPAEAPPVVLIHGWTCAVRFWRLQVQDLRADHRVIAFDLRGHGASGAPADGDWSLDTFGDDLEAVLDACADRPALIAGHSLGAMTIAAWAGRHPDSVARRAREAVLINTGLGDLISESLLLRTPDGMARVRQLIGGAALGASVPLPPRPDPLSHRIVKAVALDPTAGPGAVRLTEQMVLDTPPRVRAGCGRELSKLDLLDRLEHLTVPTTVIYGDHDLLTPKAHALRLAEALPDCRDTIELRDCGHMGPLEHPDAVTAALPVKLDVHQHLWTAPLLDALRSAELLDGETLTLPGEPPSRVVADDLAARAQLVRDDGLDRALVVPSLALGPQFLDAYHAGCRDLPDVFRAWCSTHDPDELDDLLAAGFVGLCLAAPDVTRAEAVLARLGDRPLFVHPGAGAGTPYPALTDYVTQMHTAWFTLPRGDFPVVWAMCAGLAPLHHERAALRGAPAHPGERYDISSYGLQALAAMEAAGCTLVYGSDRPVVEPVVRDYFNSAEVFLSS